ncbi:MAG: hypothetical protein IIV61_00490, partial [Oscillospiraceae bacterium]|nr:hypothetical protein [Oscillospiraceae bacterium]
MFLDRISDCGWVLAIRERLCGQEAFLGHTQRPFKLIRNPWRYWCADPFLIHHDGVEYIFCEAFDILKDRGILAYRTIDRRGRVSKLRPCLDTGSHLSYPHIFRHDGQMYMIPESDAAGEVALYRATQFPDRWQKQTVLLKDISACDTDLVSHQGDTYLLTQVFDRSQIPYVYDSLYLYIWDGARFRPCSAEPIVHGAQKARNAGAIFEHEGTLHRVSQDCAEMYGESITFHQIDRLDRNGYEEHPIQQLRVSDIRLDRPNTFEGIHTYNADERYEIIDLQRKKWFRP